MYKKLKYDHNKRAFMILKNYLMYRAAQRVTKVKKWTSLVFKFPHRRPLLLPLTVKRKKFITPCGSHFNFLHKFQKILIFQFAFIIFPLRFANDMHAFIELKGKLKFEKGWFINENLIDLKFIAMNLNFSGRPQYANLPIHLHTCDTFFSSQ